jgi:hypothetical protein
MKRLSFLIAILTTLFAFAVPASAAGPHFMKTAPECHVSGSTVTCDSSTIAGVGNYNAVATLDVVTVLSLECHNPGTNEKWVPPHDTTNHSGATTGQLEPKNGKLVVPQLSASADTSIPGGLCPNGNWTPVITNVDFHYTYTITFLSSPPSTFFSTSG